MPARRRFPGKRTGEIVVQVGNPGIMEPLLDGFALEAEPLVCHLLAHPLLLMLHQIDDNDRAAWPHDAAQRRHRAGGIGQEVQHHDAKRRINAMRSHRQIEHVALAKFDVVDAALLRDCARPTQHLIGQIYADHLAGEARQLEGQAAGATADIGEG
jgi:hypothetical protein